MTTQLTAYANGVGIVTADQLDTFLQGTPLATDLLAFVGVTGMFVFVGGSHAVADGGQGTYYWNASAVGPTSIPGVVVPTAARAGAWVLIPGSTYTPPAVADQTIMGNNSGTVVAPSALTVAQVTAMLNAFGGDGLGNLKGLVPAPLAGDAALNKALAASGGWGRVGYIGVPVPAAISLPHTLTEFDVGLTRAFAATGTVTVPTGMTVGDVFDLMWTSGTGTVALAGGVTLLNPVGGATGGRTVTGPGSITIQCIASNSYWVRGAANVT